MQDCASAFCFQWEIEGWRALVFRQREELTLFFLKRFLHSTGLSTRIVVTLTYARSTTEVVAVVES